LESGGQYNKYGSSRQDFSLVGQLGKPLLTKLKSKGFKYVKIILLCKCTFVIEHLIRSISEDMKIILINIKNLSGHNGLKSRKKKKKKE